MPPSRILNLPDPLLIKVLEYLSPCDLGQMAQTCREVQTFIERKEIRAAVTRIYFQLFGEMQPTGQEWKQALRSEALKTTWLRESGLSWRRELLPPSPLGKIFYTAADTFNIVYPPGSGTDRFTRQTTVDLKRGRLILDKKEEEILRTPHDPFWMAGTSLLSFATLSDRTVHFFAWDSQSTQCLFELPSLHHLPFQFIGAYEQTVVLKFPQHLHSITLMGKRGLAKQVFAGSFGGVSCVDAQAATLLCHGREGDHSRSLYCWDHQNGRSLYDIPIEDTADSSKIVSLSRKEALFLAGTEGGAIDGYRARRESRAPLFTLRPSLSMAGRAHLLRQEGALLAAGYQRQWLTVWDLHAQQPLRALYTGTTPHQSKRDAAAVTGNLIDMTFDGQLLTTLDDQGLWTLWDLRPASPISLRSRIPCPNFCRLL